MYAKDCTAQRIAGGYLLIEPEIIASAWKAVQAYNGPGRAGYALRMFLGILEALKRRQCSGCTRSRITCDELAGLAGGRPRDVPAVLRWWERAGLITWRAGEIRLQPARSSPGTSAILALYTSKRGHLRRQLALPRRILRHLARRGARSDAAMVLAAARCVWPVGGQQCRLGGCVPIAAAARAYGVGRRAMQQACRRLEAAGYLRVQTVEEQQQSGPAWHAMRRARGTPVQVEASYAPGAGAFAPCRPGPAGDSAASKYHTCIRRRSIPKPARAAGGGAMCVGTMSRRHLADPECLRGLYERARSAGLAPDCQGGRVEFMAVAAHAARRGADPPAMFRAMIERGRQYRLPEVDGDAGQVLARRAWPEQYDRRIYWCRHSGRQFESARKPRRCVCCGLHDWEQLEVPDISRRPPPDPDAAMIGQVAARLQRDRRRMPAQIGVLREHLERYTGSAWDQARYEAAARSAGVVLCSR